MRSAKLNLKRSILCAAVLLVTPAAALDKVTLGTGVDPTLSQAYVGVEAGIFKKHGLDVDVKLFASASASAASLIPGDIQVSLAGPAAGAMVHAKADNIVLLAQTNLTRDYYGTMAQADIKTVADLKGKKVGVAMGSSSEVFATNVLKKSGMTLADVSVVNVEAPEMLAALQRKDIVAAFFWEPWITRGKLAYGNTVHVLPGTTDIYTPQVHLLMDRKWIEKNPDIALRLVRAITEASDFLNQKPQESAAMVGKFLKLDAKLVEGLMAKMGFRTVLTDTSVSDLRGEVEPLIAAGRIKGPFNYTSYIYPDLLKKVDPGRVSYSPK